MDTQEQRIKRQKDKTRERKVERHNERKKQKRKKQKKEWNKCILLIPGQGFTASDRPTKLGLSVSQVQGAHTGSAGRKSIRS